MLQWNKVRLELWSLGGLDQCKENGMAGSQLIKALFLFFFLFWNTVAKADNIVWKETKIPMQEAGSRGLETLLVWPDSPGKHPVALLSHGSPRDAKDRAKMTAIYYMPVAMEFARRGFAVAVVLRRGYGSSGGGWVEDYGTCEATNYLHAALESSADLKAAISYLGTLPQFDIDRILAVGVSAGGFATVALTALSPPKGLIAAISFAGGRGSNADDTVCQEDSLIATFGLLGKTSHIPMLWVYAKNDHFFTPATAEKFLNAFNSNGGNATLLLAPAFGDDGHQLFSAAGIPQWTPLVDNFLKSQHLELLNELLPLSSAPQLAPPPQLSAENKKAFLKYLASGPHKAFAIDATGAYGWRTGRRTTDEAEDAAIELCEQHTENDCGIYSVDNEYYAEESE